MGTSENCTPNFGTPPNAVMVHALSACHVQASCDLSHHNPLRTQLPPSCLLRVVQDTRDYTRVYRDYIGGCRDYMRVYGVSIGVYSGYIGITQRIPKRDIPEICRVFSVIGTIAPRYPKRLSVTQLLVDSNRNEH